MNERVPEMDALISDHIDGSIDADGSARLDEWLSSNREHQRRFLRMVMDHKALQARHAAEHHRPRRIRPKRVRGRFSPSLAQVSVLAASGILLVSWWLASGAGTGTSRPANVSVPGLPLVSEALVAHLVHAGSSEEIPAAVASLVAPGDRIRVESGGHLALRYPDGTTLQFAGDTEARLPVTASGIAMELVHGRIDAQVSPQPAGHPALITTSDATITVLGTILAVTSHDGESLTEVSRGKVSMQRISDHTSVAISAGQYALSATAQPLAARTIGSPSGTIYLVGSELRYKSLDDLPPLNPGDVVELQSGIHSGAFRWTANGTTLRPITVRSASGGSPAVLDGTGIPLGMGQTPHALFDITGAHYIVDGIEFRHAHNGGTATGIICSHGANHTRLLNCRIIDCDKGIDATDDDLLIERCDIQASGSSANDGFCHGLLLAGAHAVLRECDIHDTLHGQGIKSHSHFLEIRSCRITDAEDGELGIIDSGPGSTSDSNVVLIGNLLASKPGRHGNQQRFIEVGNDSGGNRQGSLILIQNTFVAADPRIIFIATAHSAMRTVASNNIFVGSDRIAALGPGGVSGTCDWMPPNAVMPNGIVTNARLRSPDPGFMDPAARDFRLRANSVCLRNGLADPDFVDDHGQSHPVGAIPPPGLPGRIRIPSDLHHPDIGAYGSGSDSQ
jgi:ferric-dicitrate binding protein FerR (iron transport regulator)